MKWFSINKPYYYFYREWYFDQKTFCLAKWFTNNPQISLRGDLFEWVRKHLGVKPKSIYFFSNSILIYLFVIVLHQLYNYIGRGSYVNIISKSVVKKMGLKAKTYPYHILLWLIRNFIPLSSNVSRLLYFWVTMIKFGMMFYPWTLHIFC